ncbi:MAG: transposase [Phototrophicaceae bacterium]
MQAKKQYTDDFKKEAIHLLETSGKTVTQIERDLGISHGLLRKWQKRFQVNPKTSKLELSEVENLKAELRQMKRELEIARMERDILNKTVGIFSKDQRV